MGSVLRRYGKHCFIFLRFHCCDLALQPFAITIKVQPITNFQLSPNSPLNHLLTILLLPLFMFIRLLSLQKLFQDPLDHLLEELGLRRGFETNRLPAQRACVLMHEGLFDTWPAEGMSTGCEDRFHHDLQTNWTAELFKSNYLTLRHPSYLLLFKNPLPVFFLTLGQPLHNTFSQHPAIHNLHILQIFKLLISLHLPLPLLALRHRFNLTDALAEGLLD